MDKKQKRWLWLLAGVLLLVGAAVLMAGIDPDPIEKPRRADVTIPRRMSDYETARNQRRRTLVPLVALDSGVVLAAPSRASDPMLSALPPTVKRGALVVEANAIRHSALGQLMVDCFTASDDRLLNRLRDAGIDPLEQVDRVAMFDNTLMVSGDFKQARLTELFGASTSRGYGRDGTIYDVARPDGGVFTVGAWKDQMLVSGRDEADVTAALDRLEGVGTATAPPVLSEDEAYGEIYGVVESDVLSGLLRTEDPALADRLNAAASKVRLHVTVTGDVGLSADVEGTSPKESEDLRKALASTLSLARLQAKAQGNDDAAQVLELARVNAATGKGSDFRLEAGLPYAMMEKMLQTCVAEGKARRAGGAQGP